MIGHRKPKRKLQQYYLNKACNPEKKRNWRHRLTHQDQPIPQPKQGSRLSNIDNRGFSSSLSSVYFPRHAWQRQNSSDLPVKFKSTTKVNANAKWLQDTFENLRYTI